MLEREEKERRKMESRRRRRRKARGGEGGTGACRDEDKGGGCSSEDEDVRWDVVERGESKRRGKDCRHSHSHNHNHNHDNSDDDDDSDDDNSNDDDMTQLMAVDERFMSAFSFSPSFDTACFLDGPFGAPAIGFAGYDKVCVIAAG